MSVKLQQNASIASKNTLKDKQHILFVLSDTDQQTIPFLDHLEKKLSRTKTTLKDLDKTPLLLDLPDGGIASYIRLNSQSSPYQRHTLLRAAVTPLLAERPETIDICLFGHQDTRKTNACAAYYVTTVNAADLFSRKKDAKRSLLNQVTLHGYQADHDYTYTNARVWGNTLCRELTVTPPNELTPKLYRQKVAALAAEHGWQHTEYDMDALNKMGAGAFVAVAQGSESDDAAIVHLRYEPKTFQKHIAVVGKGICFDTGGHNLKQAKYMLGMHEDMNGSAVSLGILLAATKMQLPVKLDCWLAIAQNHIGPNAFKQNDVITALNGMSIEIVHTDAEGRMVLADTLTLAARQQPDAIIDFATLTGSMITALGDRMSGVITNNSDLNSLVIEAGIEAGERVVTFPYDDDFDSDLESDIADIKQCTLDGGADHIHAARFLGNFIENQRNWIHTDLSSANRKGGLGAVATDCNGFGVGFGLALIKRLLEQKSDA